MSKQPKNPEQYLREPYSRILIPDPDTSGFTAKILEFPGCIAEGDTPQEAYANLEEAAKGWIRAALDMGQSIPEPSVKQNYGGKVLVRFPRSLHRKAVFFAEQEGTSLNQFIVATVAEKVGAATASIKLAESVLIPRHWALLQPVLDVIGMMKIQHIPEMLTTQSFGSVLPGSNTARTDSPIVVDLGLFHNEGLRNREAQGNG